MTTGEIVVIPFRSRAKISKAPKEKKKRMTGVDEDFLRWCLKRMWVGSCSDGADVVDVDGRLARRTKERRASWGGIT